LYDLIIMRLFFKKNISFVIIFNLFSMGLSRSHYSSHGFCMLFFNISSFRIVLFVFDFSRYYSNSFILFFLFLYK